MERQEVAIVEIKIPFWSLMKLLLKLAIAAVPAVIVFYVLAIYLMMVLNHLPRL